MRIIVKFRGLLPSAALRQHAERRLRLHLSRFGKELSATVVRLTDTNGPKGGVDKICHLTLSGPRLGVLTIEEVRGDLEAAIHVASDRAQRTVARAMARRSANDRSARIGRSVGWIRTSYIRDHSDGS